ncbi:MAG: acyl-CoA thioesterase [Fibrobacterota bacterium]
MLSAETEIRVRYAETDKMGVVYYANYFVWFEIGRTDLMAKAGMSYDKMEDEGYFLPVLEAKADYKSPAKYGDVLFLETKVRLLKGFKIYIDYKISKESVEVASGATVNAFLGPDWKPVRPPRYFLDSLGN